MPSLSATGTTFSYSCTPATCRPGDVAKGHGRADVDAPGRVVPSHHAGLVAAGDVQAKDGVAVGVEHAGLRVGLQPDERAEAAGQHLDGIERPLLDGRERRVGSVLGIARAAVESRGAAAELRVLAAAGVRV